jgi:hypothetical protein
VKVVSAHSRRCNATVLTRLAGNEAHLTREVLRGGQQDRLPERNSKGCNGLPAIVCRVTYAVGPEVSKLDALQSEIGARSVRPTLARDQNVDSGTGT